MGLTCRRAVMADLPRMKELVAQAQESMRTSGIHQWQNGYPSPALLTQDIDEGMAFVLEEDGTVMAMASLRFGADPDYAKIHEGNWLTQGPYCALHRVAVAGDCKRAGLASALFGHLLAVARAAGVASMRCDTHRDNGPMNRFLQKNGFAYCGIIYLVEDGDERLAYERPLQ